MAPEKRSHDDYSVGWICALPKEQTAATAMLDKRHPGLPKPMNDTNTYTLGSIGSHNVVIACLPKGQYGTNSAANVATLMISSFPSIKIGLMVGIGRGVPPKVRLGDVVISTPSGQHPGVVQWDLGRAIEGGTFERTGALSNPPSSLLTALAKLETEHEPMGSKIPGFLEELEEKFPRLAKKYLKSDSLQDVLFKPNYPHANEPFTDTEGPTGAVVEPSQEEVEEGTEEEYEEPCPFCDKNNILQKKRRSMRVHYGLIASGNKVIKDGLYRDKLNAALGGNVLCFEMEAAGLMNSFPCLVIRGICDYCDSHKNKHWQEHAAAVAAEFAKELLGCIQPSAVEGEQLIREMIRDGDIATTLEIKFVLTVTVEDGEVKKQGETLNWLSSLDFDLLQSKHFGNCQPNTGQEFINSDEVQSWISTTGKTCQMAILVNHLMEKFQGDDTVGVAYLYYNYKQHYDQKPEHMLASLVKQLAQNSRPFPDAVHQLHHRHEPKKTYPLLRELSNTFSTLVHSFFKVYILIDALDEGDDTDRMIFLHEIFTIQEATGLNLFATSRAINSIAATCKGSISRDIYPTTHDISQFLDANMSEFPSFVVDDANIQKEIKAKVESAVGGMFLLAQLYIGALSGKGSLEAVKETLDNLHQASSSFLNKFTVLDQAYGKSMERIQQLKENLSTDGILIISWIVKAKRQLRLTELQEVLAIDIGSSRLNANNIPTIEDIIQSCASLVIVEGDNPLYNYSVGYWGYHVNEALAQGLKTWRVIEFLTNETMTCMVEVLAISEPEEELSDWYQDLLYGCSQEGFYEFTAGRLTAVHVAAFFGLYDAVAGLLMRGFNRDAKDSLSRGPISWAAWNGHARVIQLLLGWKTDLETGDEKYGWTPLMIAVRRGHEAVVELLGGCHIDAKSSRGCTSLHMAVRLGNEAMIDLLIRNGAYINAEDNYGRTPLAIAAMEGRLNTVDRLLKKGAEIESKDSRKRTPLMLAIIGKHKDLVRYFVKKGADVEVLDDDKHTPLSMAIQEHFENIPKICSRKDINMNAAMRNVYTPLTLAIEKEDFTMVNWFVEQGANLDAMDGRKTTPLLAAIDIGHQSTVELLVDKGADLEVQSSNGSTPLILATKRNHWHVVEILIQKGAQLEAKTSEDKFTALHIAARGGYLDIIQLLIDKGANVEARDNGSNTPLIAAASTGMPECVQLLLANKANIEARNNNGYTPLSMAGIHGGGGAASIQLLLDSNADIEAKDHLRETPLVYAIRNRKAQAANILLQDKANAEYRGASEETLMHIAVNKGDLQSIRVLFAYEAVGVDEQDKDGLTPLSYAAVRPKNAIVTCQAMANFGTIDVKAIAKVLLDSRGANDYAIAKGLLNYGRANTETVTKALLNSGRLDNAIVTESLLKFGEVDKNAIIRALLGSKILVPNANAQQRHTALLCAIENRYESVVKTLLDSGKVDADKKDHEGRTPLSCAASINIAKRLLNEPKVDINSKDNQGRTPLCHAIDERNWELIRFLRERGAKTKRKAKRTWFSNGDAK
ncbi:ankyrin repeat-containing domain protein [Trichoderma compactum]